MLFITFTRLPNKRLKENITLDEVKLREDYNVPDMFAIMLEQDNGTYKESKDKTWPSSDEYVYDKLKSGCMDSSGNKINDVLSYDANSNIATVETSNTTYCYLYFSTYTNLNEICSEYNNIDECETKENLEEVKGIWDSTLEDDGYRYIGTNPNNYICFGTTNQEECKNDTDKYMYRIIGIFEDETGKQHLKLIKKEALNSSKAWEATYNQNIPWEQSDLYLGINGSYFYTNTTDYPYMGDTSWTNKITTWNYTATNTKTYENYNANGVYGPYLNNNTGKTTYLYELNRESKKNEICDYNSSTTADCSVGEWTTVPAKIGLMYVSDYQLSLGELALDYTPSSNYNTLKAGWMHLSNNDLSTLSTTGTNPPNSWEWTMSHYGATGSSYGAWFVGSYGDVPWGGVNSAYSVRSVFYLYSNVKLTSGDGSSANPFILS